MNKKIFKITFIQESNDCSFWKDKTYLERIKGLEKLRRIIFGYDSSAQRLQRISKVTKLSKD